MTGIRGVIFDCDGVLFASHAANLAYYNAVLVRLGEPPVRPEEREKAHLCHTAASPQVFAEILGTARAEEALALAAVLDYRQFIPYMTPEPEMAETLALLASRRPLAVATNRGNSMEEVLRHFGLETFFQAVVTSRDVVRPKPWPDMLLLAAERIGIATEELLFVGDSELDLAAARGAGIRFVAYKEELGGELRVNGFRELGEILQLGSEEPN